MIFKSSFKYLKNEKINLIKVILKLECFLYKNILILFNLIVYLLNHLDSKKNERIVLIEIKLSICKLYINDITNHASSNYVA